MWPGFDLVNRGVFMEMGSPRLIMGVLETEGVKNGVSSKVYERKREAKKGEKEGDKGEGKKRGKRRKKKEKKKRGRILQIQVGVLSLNSKGDFLKF